MLVHRDTQTKDSGIFQFFCRLWLPERESAGRNAESTLHNTRRESATERKGNYQSYTPVTTYNPHTKFIAKIANRNWHFLQSKERLARISKNQH